jgi:pyridoxamine 5'-phosphate oxidase
MHGTSRRVPSVASSVDAVAEPDNEHLAAMRVEYGSVEKDGSPDLDADWLADGWLALLRKWIDDAERAGIAEPNAMVLATVHAGRPVSRSVLCKGVDEDGITFFTNYDSAKGDELAATPYASATFPWYLLNRQFHIRGPVTKVDPQASQDYWSKRRAARSWAPGRRTNQGRSPPGQRWSSSSPR